MSFTTMQNVLDVQSSSQKDFLLEDWGNFDQVGAGQKQARLDWVTANILLLFRIRKIDEFPAEQLEWTIGIFLIIACYVTMCIYVLFFQVAIIGLK